ncbi:hypothetical protein DOM22_02565 [Bdellovibrio sp. ZAP7]|nr:hypothetical protein DOM22_02565 [Bdellovibrio sp. ZAP7]
MSLPVRRKEQLGERTRLKPASLGLKRSDLRRRMDARTGAAGDGEPRMVCREVAALGKRASSVASRPKSVNASCIGTLLLPCMDVGA